MNYLLWTSIAVLLAVLPGTNSQQTKSKATSDELCKHPFHSFLCNAPKSPGRRRVYNGQIQGPPPPPIQNVLEGANTFPQGSRLRPDKPKVSEQPNLIPDTSNVFQAEAYLPPNGAPPPPPDRTYIGDNSNRQSQALLPPREKPTTRPTPPPLPPTLRPTTTTPRPIPTRPNLPLRFEANQNSNVQVLPDKKKEDGCGHSFHSYLCETNSKQPGNRRRPHTGQKPPGPPQESNIIGDNSFLQSEKVLPPTTRSPPVTYKPYVRPTTTPKPSQGSYLLQENRYLPPVQKVPPPVFVTPAPRRPIPPPVTQTYEPDIQPDGAQNPSVSLRPADSEKSHGCKHAFHSFLCDQPRAGSKRRNYNGQRQGPPQQNQNVIGQNSFLQPSKLLPPTATPLFADNSFIQSTNLKPNANTYLPPPPSTPKYFAPTTQRSPPPTTRYSPPTTQRTPPSTTRYSPPTTQRPPPSTTRYSPPTTRRPLPPTTRYSPPTTQKPPPPPTRKYLPPTTPKPPLQPLPYLPPKLEKPEPNLVGGNSFLDTSRVPPPTPPPSTPPRRGPQPDIAPDAAQNPSVQIRPDQPKEKNNCGHPFHSFLCDAPKSGGRRRIYNGRKPEPAPQNTNFIGENSFPQPAKIAPPSFSQPPKIAQPSFPQPAKIAPTQQPYKAKVIAPQFPRPTTSAPLVADNSFLQETQLRPRENTYLPPPPPTPTYLPPRPKDPSTNINLFGDDSFLDPTRLRPPTQKPTPPPVRSTTPYDPVPQPDEGKNIAAHAFHSFLYQKPKSGGRRIYNGQRPSRSPQNSEGLIPQSRRVARQVVNAAVPAAAGDHDHHHHDAHHGDHHGGHADHHHDHNHHHHNITLEQLCRDPFHAFLCDPVDTSRRQVYDGEPYTPDKRGRMKGKLFGASSIIQAKRVRPEPNSLIAGVSNPKESFNPEVQILRKEQKLTQNVPSFYQSTTESVPIFYRSTTQNAPTFYQSTTENVPRFYQSSTQKVPSFVLQGSNRQQYSPEINRAENVDIKSTARISNQQALGNVPNANVNPSVQHSNVVSQPDLNSLQGIRNALLAEKVDEPIKIVKPQSRVENTRIAEPLNKSPERVLFQPIVVRPQELRPRQSNVEPVARAQGPNYYRQPKVIDASQQVYNRPVQQNNSDRERQRPVRRRRLKARPVSDENRTPIDRQDVVSAGEARTHVPLHRNPHFHSLHTWQDGGTVRTFGEKIRQRRLPQGERSLPDVGSGPVSPAVFARGPRGIDARHLISDAKCSFPFHGYECNQQSGGKRVKREEKRVFTGQGRATEPEEETTVPKANRDEKHVQKIERRTRPVVKHEKVVVTEKTVEKEKEKEKEKKEEKRVFTGQGSITPPEDEEVEEKKPDEESVTTTEDPQIVYQRGIDEEKKRREDDLKAREVEKKNREEELKRRDEEQIRRDEEDKRRAAALKDKIAKDKTTENPHIAYEKGIKEEEKRRAEEQKRRDEEDVRREEEAERRKIQEIEVEKELERRKIQQKLVDEELERRKEERERTMIEEERRKKIKELDDD